ncbi:MAG: type II toxin-antitoxin system VapC family toxin [Oscillospiraceae bacterium]|nr:type II toxin-antitoxin system VapC family toxin [Oscillospiraceae bacterium]
MKYLLDTNICIFLMQDEPNVRAAFFEKKKDGIAISAITLAELEFGVNNSKSSAAADRNRIKLISFLTLVDVLEFDSKAAAEYGKIFAVLTKNGNRIGILDTQIAAHAKSAGLIVVTNNTREFERIDRLTLEDWTK